MASATRAFRRRQPNGCLPVLANVRRRRVPQLLKKVPVLEARTSLPISYLHPRMKCSLYLLCIYPCMLLYPVLIAPVKGLERTLLPEKMSSRLGNAASTSSHHVTHMVLLVIRASQSSLATSGSCLLKLLCTCTCGPVLSSLNVTQMSFDGGVMLMLLPGTA